ncbi:hypothetical protein EJ08DRAFT_293004 [Tothia fuscella]|uniref:Uncharacterized protein n=1 Tax=Tothia fuscella TaxID=1048955 RepID=A0A9P4P2S4_9PEZI|nr:hypothetical protein EJ08DRAFT_293004 [Tothia fuscella]
MKEYVHLLRQHREHKKLEIIQDALSTLVDAGSNPTQVDIKSFLKDALGEPPQPPIAAIDQNDAQARVDELTFRLKKELLIARSRVEEANAAKEAAEKRAGSAPQPSLQTQVAALRKARVYMIEWVEGELGKVPENDADASQADISFMDGDESKSQELSDAEITAKVQELYNVYITARERLTANVDATSKISQHLTANSEAPKTKTSPTKGPTKSTSPSQPVRATDILPYLKTLLQSSREETALLQQTSHLRRQLTLASEETDQTIQRLAGESYLVPQDTVSMNAWTKAADEAFVKTEEYVQGHVQAGEESVGHARVVLDKLDTRRIALEKMKGDL